MATVDRQRNSQREQLRAAKKRPQQESPILESFLAQNTQTDIGAKKCQEALKVQGDLDLWRPILSQEGLHALIIVLMGVNMAHYIPVPLVQHINVHARDDVRRAVNIIARHVTEQAALLLQTLIESCAGRGLQETDHCRHNPAFLDKINLPLEDRIGVTVEAYNEAPLYL